MKTAKNTRTRCTGFPGFLCHIPKLYRETSTLSQEFLSLNRFLTNRIVALNARKPVFTQSGISLAKHSSSWLQDGRHCKSQSPLPVLPVGTGRPGRTPIFSRVSIEFHWASWTGLTAVSKFKPRLHAQWAVGTHRKGPSGMEKGTFRMNWPIRNTSQIRNQI